MRAYIVATVAWGRDRVDVEEVALRTACRHAGIRQIGWHVLRHTFASTLAQRGGTPKAIQELMGHSDMVTTMRYMHLAPAHHVEAIALLDDPDDNVRVLRPARSEVS